MHPPHSIENYDGNVGLGLVGFERDMRDHFTRSLRHVARRQAVQRVDQHIVTAHVAATEIRYGTFEFLKLSPDRLLLQILHPTMVSSFEAFDGMPVKVAPVVPVNRTSR